MRFCGYSNKTSVSTLYCLILDRPFPINVTGVAHDKYSQFSISGDGGGGGEEVTSIFTWAR